MYGITAANSIEVYVSLAKESPDLTIVTIPRVYHPSILYSQLSGAKYKLPENPREVRTCIVNQILLKHYYA